MRQEIRNPSDPDPVRKSKARARDCYCLRPKVSFMRMLEVTMRCI